MDEPDAAVEGFCLVRDHGDLHAKSVFMALVNCPLSVEAVLQVLKRDFKAVVHYSVAHRAAHPAYVYLGLSKQVRISAKSKVWNLGDGCHVYLRRAKAGKPGPTTVAEITAHTVRLQWTTMTNVPAADFAYVLQQSPEWARLATTHPEFAQEALRRINGIPVNGTKVAVNVGADADALAPTYADVPAAALPAGGRGAFTAVAPPPPILSLLHLLPSRLPQTW